MRVLARRWNARYGTVALAEIHVIYACARQEPQKLFPLISQLRFYKEPQGISRTSAGANWCRAGRHDTQNLQEQGGAVKNLLNGQQLRAMAKAQRRESHPSLLNLERALNRNVVLGAATLAFRCAGFYAARGSLRDRVYDISRLL